MKLLLAFNSGFFTAIALDTFMEKNGYGLGMVLIVISLVLFIFAANKS